MSPKDNNRSKDHHFSWKTKELPASCGRRRHYLKLRIVIQSLRDDEALIHIVTRFYDYVHKKVNICQLSGNSGILLE